MTVTDVPFVGDGAPPAMVSPPAGAASDAAAAGGSSSATGIAVNLNTTNDYGDDAQADNRKRQLQPKRRLQAS